MTPAPCRRLRQWTLPKVADPGPCRHLGRDLTGPERQAAGLDHDRRWALCVHENKPLGGAVCGCRGCGPKCPGYSPEDST